MAANPPPPPPTNDENIDLVKTVYDAMYVQAILSREGDDETTRNQIRESLAYDAKTRIANPIGGCYGVICTLKQKFDSLKSCAKQPPAKKLRMEEDEHPFLFCPIRPCAASIYEKSNCSPTECMLAYYFPPEKQREFLNAQSLFGFSGILRTEKLSTDLLVKRNSMLALLFESKVRARDPVGGIRDIILKYKRKISLQQSTSDNSEDDDDDIMTHDRHYFSYALEDRLYDLTITHTSGRGDYEIENLDESDDYKSDDVEPSFEDPLLQLQPGDNELLSFDDPLLQPGDRLLSFEAPQQLQHQVQPFADPLLEPDLALALSSSGESSPSPEGSPQAVLPEIPIPFGQIEFREDQYHVLGLINLHLGDPSPEYEMFKNLVVLRFNRMMGFGEFVTHAAALLQDDLQLIGALQVFS